MPHRLYRLAPDGVFAAETESGELRYLYSNPYEVAPGGWELGRPVGTPGETPPSLLPPVFPPKVVGIGRNYKEHVKELENPMPAEPVLFLKATSSIIGPLAPIVLPPESQRVEFEGEIAIVLRQTLRRAGADEARAAVLGVTAACDVTARDLQRRDPCFSRAKSFDSFCPIGPCVLVGPDIDLEDLSVETRVNGVRRQQGHVRDMTWGIVELLVYASRMMTLEAGDVILTGTPSGVGTLADGDTIEVEVAGVGALRNPVENFRREA